MTIPLWLIPLGVTACFWGWGIFAPWPPSRGDYDFSGMFTGMFRLAVCVTGTLLAWLVFFAAKVAAQ
jgi:hypothetical protein